MTLLKSWHTNHKWFASVSKNRRKRVLFSFNSLIVRIHIWNFIFLCFQTSHLPIPYILVYFSSTDFLHVCCIATSHPESLARLSVSQSRSTHRWPMCRGVLLVLNQPECLNCQEMGGTNRSNSSLLTIGPGQRSQNFPSACFQFTRVRNYILVGYVWWLQPSKVYGSEEQHRRVLFGSKCLSHWWRNDLDCPYPIFNLC